MNAKWHRILIMSLLLAAMLVLAGCGGEAQVEPTSEVVATATAEPEVEPTAAPTAEPTPTTEPEEEVPPSVWTSVEVALGYILASDGPALPAIDSGWQVENITPEGLLGSTTFQFTNGDYVVTVYHPIVAPDATVDQVVAENKATGYRWEGQVDAEGQVVSATTVPPFEPATFRSDPYGYEFDYPAEWTVSDQGQIGDRGSAVQFLDGDQVAMQATLYQWDPKNDLAAYIDHRKPAWEASGMTLLAEEEWQIEDGHPAAGFTLETQEGVVAYFFLTAIQDRYLELSSDLDPALLSAVAHTMRLFEPVTASEAHTALGCQTAVEGTPEWVACNVMDGLISRNTAALPSHMADEFIIGYWLSEGVTVPAGDAPAELANLLPADPAASPLTFTTDQSQFPDVDLSDQGLPVEGMFGADVDVTHVIYSQGWGQDGQGGALIFIAQDAAGEYYWHGMIYSGDNFAR